MQVNPEEQFEEAFVDLAWSQMKTILDKEMPEKEKKRKFLWLWLLGAGLLLLSGGWLTWYYKQPQPSPSKIYSSEQPIAQQNAAILEENCEVEATKIATSIQKVEKALIAKFNPDKSSRTSKENAVPAFEDQSSVELHQTNISHSITSNPLSLGHVTNALDSSNLLSSAARTIPLLSPLPMNGNPILTFDKQRVYLLKQLPLSNTKTPTPWVFGFRIGGIWDLKQDFSGYAGTYLAYAFHPKWNVQVGLNYLNAPKANFGTLPLANSEKFDSVSRVSSAVLPEQLDALNATIETLSTSYIQVPLQVEYKLGNRWNMQLGASYWINIRSDEQKELETNLTNLDQALFTAYQQSLGRAINELPTSQFTLFGGLSYQIKPKWSIETQYHYQSQTNSAGLTSIGIKYKW